MKYVPFITVCIDDERGCNWLTQYDEEFDTQEEAEEALEDMQEDSDGTYGIILMENGRKVDQWSYGSNDDADDDGSYEDYGDIEMGFNPYMGCYDFDC